MGGFIVSDFHHRDRSSQTFATGVAGYAYSGRRPSARASPSSTRQDVVRYLGTVTLRRCRWSVQMQSNPELQRAVNHLATRLGMPLVLEDSDQQLIVHSPHDDLIDTMRQSSILRRATPMETVHYFDNWDLQNRTEGFVVPGDPASGVLPRLCLSIRRDGQLLGFVWGLLPVGATVVPDTGDISADVGVVARLLERAFEEGARGSQLLLDLVSPLQGERDQAAALLAEHPGFGADKHFTVIVCQGKGWDHPAVRRSFWNTSLSGPGDGQLKALRLDRGIALIGSSRADAVDRVVLDAALVTIRRAADGALTTLAVGSNAGRLLDVHVAYEDAARAARVACCSERSGVTLWSELGAQRFLSRLGPDELRASLDPRVAVLAVQDPLLAETLTRYLEASGSVQQVAEDVHVHRATLYQRLGRLKGYGLDLRSGEDRVAAHLSFMALRLLAED